jgi:hypothetical protein
MINKMKLKPEQVALCSEIIAYFGAKTGEGVTEELKTRWAKGLFRRVELLEAHGKLRNRLANPYFITKNLAAKAAKKDGEHLYNVQRFIDFAAKNPTPETAEPAKPAKAKKEAKGKKEAKPAKGKKVKAPTAEPAMPEPVAETMSEPALAE